MKKVLLIAAVASFTLASCKKDYTCECTNSKGEVEITYTATMKKKDADSWCTTWNSGYTPSGGKCTLK
jgi:hypothetical protein